MKKIFFLCMLGIAVLPECFSQNMLLSGGEFNAFKPSFWAGTAGANFKLFNEYIQDDILLGFGGLKVQTETPVPSPLPLPFPQEMEIKETQNFLFFVKDNFYFTLDGRIAGLRAGVSAALGFCKSPNFPKSLEMFFYASGFVGVAFFPKSLVSVTLDVCPGYGVSFRVTNAPGIALNESGFILPVSLGLRFNLDKL